MKVVDISHWQEKDVLYKLKGKIQGVMIRVGHGTIIDRHFANFYMAAVELGLKIGFYWYYDSKSLKGMKVETELFLTHIAGLKCDLPVAIDAEMHENVPEINTIIRQIGKQIEDAGYFCIIYSNKNYLANVWDAEIKKRFAFWVAHWEISPMYVPGTYGETCYMIQYSNVGNVIGYYRPLDVNDANDDLLVLVEKTMNKNQKPMTMEEICDMLMAIPNGDEVTYTFRRNANEFYVRQK